MTTGIWREVRPTAEATDGYSATNRSVILRRSSGAATRARTTTSLPQFHRSCRVGHQVVVPVRMSWCASIRRQDCDGVVAD
jgi:hypothetical protein